MVKSCQSDCCSRNLGEYGAAHSRIRANTYGPGAVPLHRSRPWLKLGLRCRLSNGNSMIGNVLCNINSGRV